MQKKRKKKRERAKKMWRMEKRREERDRVVEVKGWKDTRHEKARNEEQERKCGKQKRDKCKNGQSHAAPCASSTWTEPPSLSAVRCDPSVSLLVTGVG